MLCACCFSFSRAAAAQATIGVALYKIDDVSSPLNRRKMDYMAKEGGLTGVLIIDASTTDPNERVRQFVNQQIAYIEMTCNDFTL